MENEKRKTENEKPKTKCENCHKMYKKKEC